MACKTDWYLNYIKIERLPSSQTNMATRKMKKKVHGVQLYMMLFWQTFEADIVFLEPKTMKTSRKTSPKNALGIPSREMLLDGSESLAFMQGKPL